MQLGVSEDACDSVLLQPPAAPAPAPVSPLLPLPPPSPALPLLQLHSDPGLPHLPAHLHLQALLGGHRGPPAATEAHSHPAKVEVICFVFKKGKALFSWNCFGFLVAGMTCKYIVTCRGLCEQGLIEVGSGREAGVVLSPQPTRWVAG